MGKIEKAKKLGEIMNRLNHCAHSNDCIVAILSPEESAILMRYFSRLQDRLVKAKIIDTVIWLRPVVWFVMGFWIHKWLFG